ncbi:MAG: NYN domain-containing protein [Tannerella sp.]|jgi:uncharacterized LabA/DUF88 family protein|nr:NYN domain-containing protein [Tannerella sp.]
MVLSNISIGLFIDGGYFEKVYNEAKKQGYVLQIGKLIRFCKRYLSNYFDLKEDDCKLIVRHYFRGRFRADEAIANNRLEKERRFEDSLIEHDVVFHYKHLQNFRDEQRGEIEREKGIDVWFALEAYEIAVARNLDIVIIFTGDGDHEMLLNKMKLLKKKAVLLTWHLDSYTGVSRQLKEEASLHIELKKILNESDEYLQFFERSN